ncbi:MAG: XdhC family protein [Rubrivivax sp.]|nr:MAG: XdhC family protein [Rubrivivax sp.]
MDSVDLEVLRAARRWRADGHAATLVVVTRTWGSAPRPVGAWMVIRDDGHVVGSVSGGCIEDDLIQRCGASLGHLSRPAVQVYGVGREQAERFGLPCGGTLELVLQPLSAAGPDEASCGHHLSPTSPRTHKEAWLDEVLAGIESHQRLARDLDVHTGQVVVRPARPGEELQFDGERLTTVHGPRWRLLLIGAGQLGAYLADMARMLDYQVEVCDPRAEYAQGWAVPQARLHTDYPDDFVIRLQPDAHTAVVALTHDPKLDDAALLEALKSSAFYVGALGSRRSNEARRERLALFDLTPGEIARLRGPVGLPIGSRTPPEIAVSILAELTAVRHGVVLARVGPAPASRPVAASAVPAACGLIP